MIYKYKHMEFFSDWEKPNLEEANNRIVLYGAGRRGSVAAHALTKAGYDFICFCDSVEEKWGQEYCGKRVISPNELKEKYADCMVLITTDVYKPVVECLKNLGIDNYYSCVHIYNNIDLDGYELYSKEYTVRNLNLYYKYMSSINKNKKYFSSLFVPLTLRCTLRCKECTYYIPYEKNEYKNKDMNFDTIVKSIDKLSEAYDFIEDVLLYGGEPLLYSKLSEMIDILAQNNKIEQITVITNGTLMPSDKVIDSLRRCGRGYVRISDYGKLSTRKEELAYILKKNGIPYEFTDYKTWNVPPLFTKDMNTDSEIHGKVLNCRANNSAIELIDGKGFNCELLAYAYWRNHMPDYNDSYVEILGFEGSPEELRQKINSYIEMPFNGQYCTACKYCTSRMEEFGTKPVAEQTKETYEFESIN